MLLWFLIFFRTAGCSSSATISNEITLGNSTITTLRCHVTSITAISDVRDKTDILPITEGITFLNQLNPVTFTWNMRDGGKIGVKGAGFIAQELLELQKNSSIGENLKLVYESNPDRLEATYGNLLPVIVKAIQDVSAENTSLKTLVNTQSTEITDLTTRVTTLETQNTDLISRLTFLENKINLSFP